MGKILVTGASGLVGRKTLLHLLEKVPAERLVALVRDPSKAADLAELGIEVRQGDYADRDSLTTALRGVEKVMLVSAPAGGDRKAAHANVVDAAVEAGVRHLVYMPIIRGANASGSPEEATKFQVIADEDIFTEEKILSSPLTYTFVRHPLFLETLTGYVGRNARGTGVRVPAGEGKFAGASRDDLAQAHAAVLAEDGHENKEYILTGSAAVSFRDVAAILSDIYGHEVPHIAVSREEYCAIVHEETGMDIGEFIYGWVKGMADGVWDTQSDDLEKLIGHKPQTASEYLRAELLGV
ncbi:SDR family oxidoreductase [Streptacidiphilus sp. EB129]|uniref:SDR family oxidoreductase n=1 Tax=Streptacidiphilus sp. EB129 TaxID=3156262 RepID=UPI003512DB11